MPKRDPLNVRYSHMKERCNNPNNKSYQLYGARGIKVCDEWESSFHAFRDWALKNGYSPELEIDRIDPDGPYSPDNCRWITKSENSKRSRRNRIFYHGGIGKTLNDWCKCLGLSYRTVNMRMHRGMSFEDAISKPTRVWSPEELLGKRFGRLTVAEFCHERTRDGRYQYICKCDCGGSAIVAGKQLRSGRTKSCGCLMDEKYPGLRIGHKKHE